MNLEARPLVEAEGSESESRESKEPSDPIQN
jgi:hypothetical protein